MCGKRPKSIVSYTHIPLILYSHTPHPILTYPSSYTHIPLTLYSHTPHPILICPSSYTHIPLITQEKVRKKTLKNNNFKHL